MKGGPPPPPPAPSLDHVTEGLFVLHEDALGLSALAGRRRMLLWDVGPRELQLARGTLEPTVDRRIPGTDVTRVLLEQAGARSRVRVELTSGEVVDLIGKQSLDTATATAGLVVKVTGAELVGG